MVPFYAARVSDLGPGDFVHVECSCGHTERLTAAMLATKTSGPDALPRVRREGPSRDLDPLGC